MARRLDTDVSAAVAATHWSGFAVAGDPRFLIVTPEAPRSHAVVLAELRSLMDTNHAALSEALECLDAAECCFRTEVLS